jgi:hypothetical protein
VKKEKKKVVFILNFTFTTRGLKVTSEFLVFFYVLNILKADNGINSIKTVVLL